MWGLSGAQSSLEKRLNQGTDLWVPRRCELPSGMGLGLGPV